MANTKVTGDVIANGTISTVHLADDAITAAKLDSTATGITFADLTVDTNTLYVDAANNSVGIGTTSPANAVSGLHIAANQSTDQLYLERTVGATGRYYLGTASNSFYIVDDAQSATRMVIDSSGNVGIGTTLPNTRLEVQGGAGSGTHAHATFTGTANRGLKISTTSSPHGQNNATVLYDSQDTEGYSEQHWLLGGNTKMVLDRNGKVGIGITSPSANLHISSTSTATLKVGTTGVADASVDIRGYDAGVHIGDATNGLRWAIWNDGPSTSSSLKFGSYALGTWYGDGAQVVTMTSGGNVGIGTTNPSYKLEVNGGTALVGGGFYVSSDQSLVTSSTYTFRDAVYINNPNSTSAAVSSNSVMSIGAMSGNSINTSLITTGAVGIGRTDPNARLDIKGAGTSTGLTFETSDASNNQTFYIMDGGKAGMQYYPFVIGADSSTTVSGLYNKLAVYNASTRVVSVNYQDSINTIMSHAGAPNYGLEALTIRGDYIAFYTDYDPSHYQGVERMRIDMSGNVGIGTTSPGHKLDVSGKIRSTGGMETTYMDFTNPSSQIGTDAFSGGFYVYDNSAYRMVIKTVTGYVGIGTTSPAQKLDVVGIIKSSGVSNSLMFSDRNTASNSWEWYSSGNNAGLYKNHNTAGTVMTINSSGNVGIGTTSPGGKLEVNAEGGGIGGYTGIKIKYGTSSVQSLYMGQVTAGNGAFIGTAQYRNGGYWQSEGTASSVINMDSAGNMSFSTNSGLTANTDFNISERMRITSGGKTLIGMTSQQNAGTLQIDSGASENGGILDIAGSGWYRYYTRVCRNATVVSQAGYWHIKTNIAANSNTMFLAKFYGYIYGSAQILDLTHAGYAYSATSTVINQGTTNNGSDPNASSAIYISANGSKVTFRIAFGSGSTFSTYFAGVFMDIAFPSPAGQGHDFEIEAQSFSQSTTVY